MIQNNKIIQTNTDVIIFTGEPDKRMSHLAAELADITINKVDKGIQIMSLTHWENSASILSEPALQKAWSWCKKVSSKSDKKKALDSDVIVSTSGMLQGGPSIWYLNRLRMDPRNAILLTGYQASGSGGRMLLDEGHVPIWDKRTPIDLEVSQFSFSTHAGHSEIVNFAEQCQAETVVVYHTDPNHARPPLVEELESKGHTVHTPINGESTILE